MKMQVSLTTKVCILVVVLQVILLAGLIKTSSGLKPGPRIDDKGKYAAQGSRIDKHDKLHLNNNNNVEQAATQDSDKSSLSGDKSGGDSQDTNNVNQEGDYEDERRITLSEPYRSLVQTSARFAIAQTSVTNYVNIDTFMDFMSDAGYALSKVSTLIVVSKAIAIVMGTLLAVAFFIPSSVIRMIDALIRHPERLMHLERYLPNGLNEMGIIGMMNEKTEEMLSRFGLNESACREQSVCQAGEFFRCAFPRISKVGIQFISENFSRPKYRSNKYLNSFLTGFIDQNCAASELAGSEQNTVPRNCASNFMKSLTFCSRFAQQHKPASAISNPAPAINTQLKSDYQTIRASRA